MKREQLYAGMATALEAGLGLDRALRAAAGGNSGPFARAANQIVADVRDGQTLAEAMAAHPQMFPEADVAMVEVGEESGELETAFRRLADWEQFKRRTRRSIVGGMVHPTLVIHVAALVVPAPQALLGRISLGEYVLSVMVILMCFYVPIAAAFFAWRWFAAQPRGRRSVDELLLKVPVLGPALRDLALSRYCRTFLAMYVAGVGPERSNDVATRTCGNAAVAAWLEPGTRSASRGDDLSEGFSTRLPEDFLSLWTSGEQAGRLDDTLERLTATYVESAETRLQHLARWLPRIVYFAICIYMVVTILKLATSVFGSYHP